MQSRLFRAQALARLSSPEQLDQVMRVTSPRSWLVLLGLAAVVLGAALWGVLGSVPRTVAGRGILTRPGGVTQVPALAPGLVLEVVVQPGQQVAPGQVVAWLQGLPAAPPEPGPDGAAPAPAGRVALSSPFGGRAIEILARPGDVVTPGQPVLSLDPTLSGLEAHLYVPVGVGKQIRAGMPVQVSPDTVPAEQFGFMRGRVRAVSEFPATAQGALTVLGSADLVRDFLSAGPVLEVTVDLDTDEGTASGYRWSTPSGAPLTVSPGTTSTGAVVLDEVRPIELMLPRGAGT